MTIGGNAGGDPDPTNTVFPNQYLVDYVRIYQVDTLNSIVQEEGKEVNIYPNPLRTGSLNIEHVKLNGQVQVFDLLGRLKYISVFDNSGIETIDLQHLSKGTYILKIIDDNADLIQLEKLIIYYL